MQPYTHFLIDQIQLFALVVMGVFFGNLVGKFFELNIPKIPSSSFIVTLSIIYIFLGAYMNYKEQ